MNDIREAICLDMFAGSGAIGIEALSRGAKQLIFIEKNRQIAQALSDNLNTLSLSNYELLQTDSITWLAQTHHMFDIYIYRPALFIKINT
jgi:16S rRNA (guanine966-N2)-methyltransferase